MKGLKKHIALSISVILLLCFSVTILPFDLLHNHSSGVSSNCSPSAGTICHHKFHISEKSKPCWLCAIHFDKTFTISAKTDAPLTGSIVDIFNENKVTAYLTKLIFTSLRGPPAE